MVEEHGFLADNGFFLCKSSIISLIYWSRKKSADGDICWPGQPKKNLSGIDGEISFVLAIFLLAFLTFSALPFNGNYYKLVYEKWQTEICGRKKKGPLLQLLVDVTLSHMMSYFLPHLDNLHISFHGYSKQYMLPWLQYKNVCSDPDGSYFEARRKTLCSSRPIEQYDFETKKSRKSTPKQPLKFCRV